MIVQRSLTLSGLLRCEFVTRSLYSKKGVFSIQKQGVVFTPQNFFRKLPPPPPPSQIFHAKFSPPYFSRQIFPAKYFYASNYNSKSVAIYIQL
jgi:hypothetical protein